MTSNGSPRVLESKGSYSYKDTCVVDRMAYPCVSLSLSSPLKKCVLPTRSLGDEGSLMRSSARTRRVYKLFERPAKDVRSLRNMCVRTHVHTSVRSILHPPVRAYLLPRFFRTMRAFLRGVRSRGRAKAEKRGRFEIAARRRSIDARRAHWRDLGRLRASSPGEV